MTGLSFLLLRVVWSAVLVTAATHGGLPCARAALSALLRRTVYHLVAKFKLKSVSKLTYIEQFLKVKCKASLLIVYNI